MELIGFLARWTPFLAGGFALNLAISVAAMALGTLLGACLGWARDGRLLRPAAGLATGVCRNVPSFVLLFYVAFLVPVEVVLDERVVRVPLWIKAAIALAIPVVGFASDQTLAYRRQRAAGLATAGATFAVAWTQYLLIILMASATASVIGTDEILGRANRVIASDTRPEVLIAVYLYVGAWFLAAGLALTTLMRLGSARRARQRAAPA
jgi:ABC-type amino acid transport system permease subunit